MDPAGPDELAARMDALTEANVRLLRRVGELEARVARLEQFGPAPAETPVPPPPPQEQWTPPEPVQEPLPAPEPEPEPAPALAHTAASTETAIGLTWVNRVGAFTLIIGAAFFFKYAVDNDWIGPLARVLLGVLAGGALVGVSERLRTHGHRLYSQGLAGAGITVIYLAFWAAHSLYGLIPAWASFLALAADTVLAGALALRHGAPALAALGLLGGYLTPPLLATGDVRPWFYFSFLLLVNGGWLTVARRRGWTWLEYMAFPLTLVLCNLTLDAVKEDRPLVTTFAAVSQWLVFIASPARFVPAAAQFFAAVSLGAWRSHGVEKFAASALPLLAGGLAAAHLWSAPGVAIMATLGFIGSAWEFLPGGVAGPLSIVLGSFVLLHPWLPLRLTLGHAARREDFTVVLTTAAFTLVAGLGALTPEAIAWRGAFTIGLAAAYLAAAMYLRARGAGSEADRDTAVALLAGIALAMATFAVVIQFDGFRVTVLWALEAAALAWLTARYDSRWLRIATLSLALVAALRFLALDAGLDEPLREARLLFNVRFLTAVSVAAALALTAWWQRPHVWAAPPWIAAHTALLAGLAMEVVGHVTRTAADGQVRSAQLVSLSVLMALYGVALVAGGVASRTRLNRVMGLVLLALVMMKLYVADVWAMARIHRVIAFLALGALLLSASFLYSRFRGKVEALLNSDTRA
jgi:uncharacterized membrane protein